MDGHEFEFNGLDISIFVVFFKIEKHNFKVFRPNYNQYETLCCERAVCVLVSSSPGQFGGCLLSGFKPLLVGLQRQDVLILQLPLGRTVTQLDGERVLS